MLPGIDEKAWRKAKDTGGFMTRIKLCGLTRIQDIEIANKLKPEYIGFIFWDRSSRNVSAIQAARLKGKLDPEIKAVGVFVNAPAEQVISYYNVGIIDIAQLHGNENEEYIKKLHDAGLTVIKAFKMKKTGENINLAGNANIETPEKPTGNAITETYGKSDKRRKNKIQAGTRHEGMYGNNSS